MKYQTEYQRNFQKRAVKNVEHSPVVERKRSEAVTKFSSSSPPPRPRPQSAGLPSRQNNVQLTVIGPNDKFSNSHLYRLRKPIEDHPPQPTTKEFAILGRNEKFQDNVVYPMRKPIVEESAPVARRREKSESHSCGIQTELNNAPRVSFDPRDGREIIPARDRLRLQSEYQQQFPWKNPLVDPTSDQMLVEEAKVRDRRSDPALPLSVIDPSEKLLADKRPRPPILEIDSGRRTPLEPAAIVNDYKSTKVVPNRNERITEYQSRYMPIPNQKKPPTRKSYEAEWAIERRRREIIDAERAHTDDEAADESVPFDKDRHKHGRTHLRRWRSEYQTTYKPFWRFDYKNGKWYKDPEAEQNGFNQNLFWYKELRATREKAKEYRANAVADHFNRDHMLQLQTGQGGVKSLLAWDTNNNEDDKLSVHSVEENVERLRERLMEERRANNQRVQSRVHYAREHHDEKFANPRSEQPISSEAPPVRTIYLDDPQTRNPTMATRALVRNLNSSSIQQHMNWDVQSISSERTITDAENEPVLSHNAIRKSTNVDEILDSARNDEDLTNRSNNFQRSLGFALDNRERTAQFNGAESRHAAGRASLDTHALDKRVSLRPQSVLINHRTNRDDQMSNPSEQLTPASRSSFQNHLNSLDRSYGARNQDDDVLSVASSRSLSSSCSLALQTHELARQNMEKYWGKK